MFFVVFPPEFWMIWPKYFLSDTSFIASSPICWHEACRFFHHPSQFYLPVCQLPILNKYPYFLEFFLCAFFFTFVTSELQTHDGCSYVHEISIFLDLWPQTLIPRVSSCIVRGGITTWPLYRYTLLEVMAWGSSIWYFHQSHRVHEQLILPWNFTVHCLQVQGLHGRLTLNWRWSDDWTFGTFVRLKAQHYSQSLNNQIIF